MKKRAALIAIVMASVMMLGGCASVKDMVTDKLEEIAGQPSGGESETGTDKDDIDPAVEAPKSDGAESLALLGDLMGEKYGDADVTPVTSDPSDDEEEYEEDVNASENQTVVTEAAMWHMWAASRTAGVLWKDGVFRCASRGGDIFRRQPRNSVVTS